MYQKSLSCSDAASLWPVRLKDGVIVCTEPSIKGITTYVLLEQQDWFEDEMDFVRTFVQPHMHVLDIGANHGVYALTMAQRITEGHVWAFEPTSAPAKMLEASIALNKVQDRCTLVRAGLSSSKKRVTFSVSHNSELNSAHLQGNQKEEVQLLALDQWLQEEGISTEFDFVKLDAEGEELAILDGGHAFFATQSPLILFAYKSHEDNNALVDAFRARGYGIYRMLPDLNLLVPYTEAYKDDYLLNLFACKPDCAEKLKQRDLLADATPEKLDISLSLVSKLGDMPFAANLLEGWQGKVDIPQQYSVALAAVLALYQPQTPAAHKPLLLRAAEKYLAGLPQNLPVRLLQLHLLHVNGFRAKAVQLAQQILPQIDENTTLEWPIVPPSSRYFHKPATATPGHWLRSVLQEFVFSRCVYSTCYMNPAMLQTVQKCYASGGHGVDFLRKTMLMHKKNSAVRVSPAAQVFDPAHEINASIWKMLFFGVSACFFADGAISPVHVVDIGASSHGKGTEPYAALMQMGIAKVTGFEPNAKACAELNAMYANDQQYTYLPHFIGGKSEETVFNETSWFMTSSLLKPNTPLLKRYEQLHELTTFIREVPIQTLSISSIPEVQDIDMIKIDVQGAELDVFEGAGEKLDDVLCIWTEVEFVPMYEGQPLFSGSSTLTVEL